MPDNIIRAGVLILGLIVSTAPAQSEQPQGTALYINAKKIQLNQKNRQMIYTGSVKLRHERMSIRGDRAISSSHSTGSKTITVTGKPVVASFTDQAHRKIRLVSDKLDYDSLTRIVVASGNVFIETGNSTLQGQQVRYEISKDLFGIQGDIKSPRISAILEPAAISPGGETITR